MPTVVLLYIKGMGFDNADRSGPNAGGKMEFYDAGSTNPQTVYGDFAGTAILGTSVEFDFAGRLTSSIYNATPVKIIIKDNEGGIIFTEDDLPGAAEASVTIDYSRSISPVTNLTGTNNILLPEHAGGTFILNKTGADVSVELPNASELANGLSFNFKVIGVENTATVTANIIDGLETIEATENGASFSLRSDAASYTYTGLYTKSEFFPDDNIETPQILLPWGFNKLLPLDNFIEPLLPRGWIDGNILVNNGDTSRILDIRPGDSKDDTNSYDIRVDDIITKDMNSTWIEGQNAGMLDTGAIDDGSNEWFYIFRIMDVSTWELKTDILASRSLLSPLLPEGYTVKRYIGAFRTNGSSNIINFLQTDDYFKWETILFDIESGEYRNFNENIITLRVPPGIRCMATVRWTWNRSDGILISNLYEERKDGDQIGEFDAPLLTSLDLESITQSGENTIMTDDQSRIRFSGEIDNGSLWLNTIAYVDYRGRNLL